MSNEDLTELYDRLLAPGGVIPPGPEAPEQELEIVSDAVVAPSEIMVDGNRAIIRGQQIQLTPEDVVAIKKILASRVVASLEKMANEWRTLTT